MTRVMRFSKYCFYIIFILLLINCSKEEAIPVNTDFTIEVIDNDYSVPVLISIKNNTSGAESYEWKFEGAIPEISTKKNPGTIKYNQKGIYKIILTASNADGNSDKKELEIQIDEAVEVDFDFEVLNNNNPPVEVKLINNTSGATSYEWIFENGSPATSNLQNPQNITFNTPGSHKILLKVSNGRETHELEKIVTVAEDLVVDFDWEVDFKDSDYQAPVSIATLNKSIGALSYEWQIDNANPNTSTEETPVILFENEGVYSITLTADNGKKTKSITKQITIFENTNLRVFNDVKLGINTAHNSNVIGALFSTISGEVYKKEQMNQDNGYLIDIAYFGLTSAFTFNQFLSPDEVQNKTFEAIENAQHTKFINSQELCGCGVNFTSAQFDALVDDSILKSLVITENSGGKKEFDNSLTPRIILFETQDGRKGAIKIKEFNDVSTESYIVVDIKVQKEAN